MSHFSAWILSKVKNNKYNKQKDKKYNWNEKSHKKLLNF